MIKVLWFLNVPSHLTLEQFEDWYLHTHTRIAKGMEGMRRYAINRTQPRQPLFMGAAQAPTHRIAEVWWDDLQAVETCFNSPGGLADLGDGMSNIGVHADSLPVVLFVEETEYPASEAIGFNLTSGSYLGRDSVVKLFGLVRIPHDAPAELPDSPPAASENSEETAENIQEVGQAARAHIAFDGWYAQTSARVSQLMGLRKQVYGKVSSDTIQIGHTMTWPPGGAPAYQRVIELWFDSVEAIDMAFVSRQGKELLEGLQQQGVTLDWVAMRNQELFFSFDADQPLEE